MKKNDLKKKLSALAVISALSVTAAVSAMPASAVPFEEMDPCAILSATVEDCQNTYKAYDIDDIAMFRLENGSGFRSVFTDTCRIYGQYESAYMMFIERNGTAEFADAQGLPEGMIVPNIEEKAKRIIENKGYKAIDMIIGKSRDTKCYIVYFSTAGGEYVLPIHDIKWSNTTVGLEVYNFIEEGKIYTTDEFVEAVRNYNEPYEGFLMGDANGDNKVDVRDCAFIVNELAMLPKYYASGDQHKLTTACDYNRDGKVDVRDAADIARSLANK